MLPRSILRTTLVALGFALGALQGVRAAPPTVLWDASISAYTPASVVPGTIQYDEAPREVAVLDPAGNLIVGGSVFGDGFSCRVVKYAAANGALLWNKAYYHGLDTSFGHTCLVAADAAGNAYLATTGGPSQQLNIVKYAAVDGAVLWTSTTLGTAPAFSSPTGMVLHASGDVIVTGSRTVRVAASDGAILWDVPDAGIGLSVATDASGHVAITGKVTNGPFYDFKTVRYAPDGTQVWRMTYNSALNKSDGGRAVAVDAAGNVYVTGFEGGLNDFDVFPDGRDIKTIKYAAADGAVLWERTFAGATGGADEGNAIAVDANGDVYVGGSTSGVGFSDFKVVKYAGATGATLWERATTSPAFESVRAIVIDAAGNLVVTGVANSTGNNYGDDFKTLKLAAPTGAVLWERTYAGPAARDDSPAAVLADASGNVVVVGLTGVALGFYFQDIKAIKYNSLGVEQWQTAPVLPTSPRDTFMTKVGVAPSGDLFAAGYFRNLTDVFDDNEDFLTVRLNGATGAPIWQATYAGPGRIGDGPYDMVVDSNGDPTVMGITTLDVNDTNLDTKTLKYSGATGQVLWDRQIGGTANRYDYPSEIVRDPSNNIIVGGDVSDTTANMARITKYAAATGAILWTKNDPTAGRPRLATDAAGNVIAEWSGSTFDGTDYLYTVRVSKYSPAGVLAWENTLVGASPLGVKTDAAGNVFAMMGVYTTGTAVRIIKYTPAGAVAWDKSIPVSVYYGNNAFLDIDASGNAVLALFDKPSTYKEARVYKLAAATGDIVWQALLADPAAEVNLHAVAVDAAGNAFITGNVGSNFFGGIGGSASTLFVVKYAASDGSVKWSLPPDYPASVGWTIAVSPDAVFIGGETGDQGSLRWRILKIDNQQPNVSMASATLNVAEDAGVATIEVIRGGPTEGAVTVNYATSSGTAIAGTHYTAASGQLAWADGEGGSKTFTIPIIDNVTVDAARAFNVTLSSAAGAALGTTPVTAVMIVDDDSVVQFASATASVNEPAGTVSLTVNRVGGAAHAASVAWSTFDGTAASGSDFGTAGVALPVSGTLNWAAGESGGKSIVIPVINDNVVEGSETFGVALSSPAGTALGPAASATVTIVDEDSGASFAQATYEVIEGGPVINVMVNRIGNPAIAMTVTWTTSNGTAIAGQDFGTAGSAAQRTGVLSWAAGDTAPKAITMGGFGNIPILNDTLMEPAETFTITLSAPTGGASLGPLPATVVTIIDDESAFDFQATAATVSEAGPNITLTVVRSGSTAVTQNVTYTTANGTATLGSDFGAAGATSQVLGILSFAPGVTSRTITIGPTTAAAPYIPVINDTLIEGPETFTVSLSSPTTGASLGPANVATVTILSDERGVSMASSALSVVESAGTANVSVARLGSPTGALSVNYSTANGTAKAGTHYGATSGMLTWADGETQAKTIVVPIIDDGAVNVSRNFSVTLSAPVGAALAPPTTTTVIITDDDNTLQFSAATASVTEGAPLVLTVTRAGGAAAPASVTWTTADGTALSGSDFGVGGVTTPVTGTLTWDAGSAASKTLTIPIINDVVAEGAKTFTVVLSSPVGATLGTLPVANITLNDNDPGVAFSAATYSVAETAATVTITVNRVGPVSSAASVPWSTSNGTAAAGQDFGTAGSATQRTGTLTWAAGDATPKAFTIPILNDGTTEGDETFTVTLGTPSAGVVLASPSSATVTILDDDIAPETALAFSQPKYLVLEGAGVAMLTVNRTDLGGGFARAASVNYATVAGTALAPSDFTAATGTLAWPAGDAAPKTFVIAIVNDAVAEPPEAFRVTLSAVTPGTSIATPEATVFIIDDDEVFPANGAMPAGWITPVAAAGGWHAANDPGAYEGAISLRNDTIGDGEAAQVEVTGTFIAGPVSFRLKVSSEAGFDFLRFYVDGVKAGEWSGTANLNWQSFSMPITAGVHTLRWSYEKDASASIGADAAWIDAVVLPR